MSYQNNNFEIRLATPSDDAEILAILEESSMPGAIQLLYTRRPSPWHSFQGEGKETGVLICCDKKKNRIVSLGVFVIKEMYINQDTCRVAYLFGLRSLQEYRLKFPLREGYEFLRELLQAKDVEFIFTSILEKNTNIIRLFSKKRLGLPIYKKLFTYSTLCLNQKKVLKAAQNKNNIRLAKMNDAEDVFQFIQKNGCCWDGFPKFEMSELLNSKSEKYILNFYISFDQNNKIIGIMNLCNKNNEKQYIVTGYNWQIRVYNCLRNILPLQGFPRFPQIKQSVEVYYIAYWLLSKFDKVMFIDLIAFICSQKKQIPFLLIGMPIDNPYYKDLHRLSYLNYKSNICQVIWENMNPQRIAAGPYYLECSSL